MSFSKARKAEVEAEWDLHKDILQRLYVSEDKSRKSISEFMMQNFGFNATKSQYERHFKKWGFRKYLKKGVWADIDCIRKRKRHGKETDVYVDGVLFPAKKVQKEIARNCPWPILEYYDEAPTPQTPYGVVICTPRSSGPPTFEIGNLPLFEFEGFIDLHVTFPQGNGLGYLDTSSVVQNQAHTLEVVSSSILKNLSANVLHKYSDDRETIYSVLKSVVPEIMIGTYSTGGTTISRNSRDGTLQFLKLMAFLVSNCHLQANCLTTEADAGKILTNLLQSEESADLLKCLLSSKGPAYEAFAENLFRSAMDAENIYIVRKLLDIGLDPNEQVCYGAWIGERRSALQKACSKDNLDLVKILVEAGADVNAKLTNPLMAESPLQLAMDGDSIELIHFLIKAGADVNPCRGQKFIDCDSSCRSPLIVAVEKQNFELVEMLLDAGANINFHDHDGLTPLFQAVTPNFRKENSIDESEAILRRLVKAGGKLNRVFKEDSDYDEGATVLERAARHGRVDLIPLLLEFGAKITKNAVQFAVIHDEFETVELLIKFGAKLKGSELSYAVDTQNIEIVRLLIEAGAKGDCVFPDGWSALGEAVIRQRVDIVILLLGAGANANTNVEAHESTYRTPLQEAALRGNAELVQILLEAGADVNGRPFGPKRQGLKYPTVLEEAVSTGNTKLVQLLLDRGARVNDGGSVLVRAIRSRSSHIFNLLLDEGADVNEFSSDVNDISSDPQIRTPLQAAAECGSQEMVRILLNAGADIDAIAERRGGKTALTAAIENRHFPVVNVLLAAGVDVNNPSARMWGVTALEAAMRIADVKLVKHLIDTGADTNDPQALLAAVESNISLVLGEILLRAHARRGRKPGRKFGCPALQRAIQMRKLETVKLLVESAVDINTPVSTSYEQGVWRCSSKLTFGQTALGTAIKEKDFAMVQMLLTSGGDPNSIVSRSPRQIALLTALETREETLVRLLMVSGANGNVRRGQEMSNTILLEAIRWGNLGIVRSLLAAGFDMNAPAERWGGRTAIQKAAEAGSIAIVEMLLDAGVDVNGSPASDRGVTALQACSIQGYIGIAVLLIEKGADINAAPAAEEGRTALEGAAEHGRIVMLQLLLNAGAEVEGSGETQYYRALTFASENGHHATRRLLESHRAGLRTNSTFTPAATCDESTTASAPGPELPNSPRFGQLQPMELSRLDAAITALPNASEVGIPGFSGFEPGMSPAFGVDWEGFELDPI